MKYFVAAYLFSILCLCAGREAYAAAGPGSTFTNSIGDYCRLDRGLTANYAESGSKYQMAGTCWVDVDGQSTAIYWNAQEEYSSKDGRVNEYIALTGNPPLPAIRVGHLNVKTSCNSDPWINAAICKLPQVGGDVSMKWVEGLHGTMVSIVTSKQYPLTADFAYDREPLIKNFNAAAAAALAEKEQRNRELRQAAGQKPTPLTTLVSPSVLSPTAGQRFVAGIAVPIRLAPPQGLPASIYMVNFQRQQPNGQWVAHTTIPVGPAQAHSASGYTGWGTGGADGRSLAFLSSPGAWRLNAQINGPKQSAWSDWVEFGVMAPPTSTNALKPRIKIK